MREGRKEKGESFFLGGGAGGLSREKNKTTLPATSHQRDSRPGRDGRERRNQKGGHRRQQRRPRRGEQGGERDPLRGEAAGPDDRVDERVLEAEPAVDGRSQGGGEAARAEADGRRGGELEERVRLDSKGWVGKSTFILGWRGGGGGSERD